MRGTVFWAISFRTPQVPGRANGQTSPPAQRQSSESGGCREPFWQSRSGVAIEHLRGYECFCFSVSAGCPFRGGAARLGMRTLDTLDVASALELKAESFWSFDQRQAKLAEAAGLKIL
jgi:hypothetical protein